MGTYATELITVDKLVFVGILEANACFELESKLDDEDDDRFVRSSSAWLELNLVKSFDDTTELNGKPFTFILKEN